MLSDKCSSVLSSKQKQKSTGMRVVEQLKSRLDNLTETLEPRQPTKAKLFGIGAASATISNRATAYIEMQI